MTRDSCAVNSCGLVPRPVHDYCHPLHYLRSVAGGWRYRSRIHDGDRPDVDREGEIKTGVQDSKTQDSRLKTKQSLLNEGGAQGVCRVRRRRQTIAVLQS